jgi:hypothetical protein
MIQTAAAMRKHNTTKSRQSGLLISKPAFLKIGLSVDLQTALAAGTRRAEGQWLQQQLNAVKLRVFRVGTGMQTVCCTVGQYVEPMKTSVEGTTLERR